MAVLWDVAPCSLFGIFQRFIRLMVEAGSSSETSVSLSNIAEDSLHNFRRENLKSRSNLHVINDINIDCCTAFETVSDRKSKWTVGRLFGGCGVDSRGSG
jgi:hypothetical protein